MKVVGFTVPLITIPVAGGYVVVGVQVIEVDSEGNFSPLVKLDTAVKVVGQTHWKVDVTGESEMAVLLLVIVSNELQCLKI